MLFAQGKYYHLIQAQLRALYVTLSRSSSPIASVFASEDFIAKVLSSLRYQ